MSSNLRKPGLCPNQAGIKELWEDLMNLMESVVFHKPSQAKIKMSAFSSLLVASQKSVHLLLFLVQD